MSLFKSMSQRSLCQISFIVILLSFLVSTGLSYFFHITLEYDYVIAGFIVSILVFIIISAFFYNHLRNQNASKEAYKQMFEKTQAIQLLIDSKSERIVDANLSACRFYGYTKNEITTLKIPDITDNYKDTILKAVESENRNFFISKHKLASGKSRDVKIYANLIEIDNQKLYYTIIQDISDRKEIEKELKKSEEKYKTIINATSQGYWLVNTNLEIIEINLALCEMLGYNPKEIIGKKLSIFYKEKNKVTQQFNKPGTIHHTYETILICKNGLEIYTRVIATTLKDSLGKPENTFAFVTNISDSKKTEDKLRLAATVFENTLEGIMITNEKGVIKSVNPAFTDITGYSNNDVVGKKANILQSGRHNKDFYQNMWDSLSTKSYWQGEIWNRRKSGEVYPEGLSISAVIDGSNKVNKYVGVFSDITGRKEYEEVIKFQAYHDALTGLPNRQLFFDRLSVALAQAQRNKYLVAVMFLDLDRFKQINDTLGHDTGDKLLQEVGRSLRICVREGYTVARLGGDEFTLLLPQIKQQDDIFRVANKIINEFKMPKLIDGHELIITTSIGISIYPSDGDRSEVLLKKADDAMYAVKQKNRNDFQLYANISKS